MLHAVNRTLARGLDIAVLYMMNRRVPASFDTSYQDAPPLRPHRPWRTSYLAANGRW